MSFIGRKEEINALSEMYKREDFQMCIIYGRRRVGKTTLLKEFCKGKEAVYFTAQRTSFKKNTELFGKKVLAETAPDFRSFSYNDMEPILDYLAKVSNDKRLIVVIDELPYLAETDKGFLSVLQSYIDDHFIFGKMFLILSGSSISFMEDEVLSEKSPIYGRRTSQMKIEPFGFLDSARFVPSYSPEDKALTYAVTGGVAKYLSFFEDTRSVDENIIDLFFSKKGYMYEEPYNLLVQEYKNVPLYNAIIDAVSDGANRLNEISLKSHMENSVVSHAMPKLISTGIIKRQHAITEENNNKKAQYVFKDTSFKFWYRFVPDGMDLIEAGSGELYYTKQVKPHLNDFMSDVFEEMSRQYLMSLNINGELPFLVTNIGKWWGTDPRKKTETDIDVVGINKKTKQAILCECKYRNEPLGKEAWEALRDRNGLLSGGYETALFMLFSKSGFTKWIEDNCGADDILLVTLEEMYFDDEAER